MIFQKVLEQAGRDGRSHIFVLVRTPLQDKWPDCLGFLLGEHANLNDGLPPRVFDTVRRSVSGEKLFSGCERLLHIHQSPPVTQRTLELSYYKLVATHGESRLRKPADCRGKS